MGGPSGRRRWAQRSCRTGSGGGGVVGRAVAVTAAAAAAGPARRPSEDFAHVDKQRRVHGIFSRYRCSSDSVIQEDYFCSDVGEFKHKISSGNPTRCLSSEHMGKMKMDISHSQSSVMANLMGFDSVSDFGAISQSTDVSRPREDNFSSKKSLLHTSGTVSDYGSAKMPKYQRIEQSNHTTHSPSPQKRKGICNFRYRLTKTVGDYNSRQMSMASANYLFAEKLSILCQLGQGAGHHNRNYNGALPSRHEKAKHGGAINISRKEEAQEQSVSSEGKYWQDLLNNAKVRGNQLNCLESLDQRQIWSSPNSESEKVICFSPNDSIDDSQISLSTDTSDTSDSSKLSTLSTVKSSLGIVAKQRWKMAFRKVYCTLDAHVDSISVLNPKEVEHSSPVSVLELPTEESSHALYIKKDMADPHELHLRLELVKIPSMENTAEGVDDGAVSDYFGSETEAIPKNETIQLVEDILEEFGDEEERDFSYLLDILIASGIHGTEEDQLYKVCHSLDCPAGHDVFEKLEKKYAKVAQWSRADRKLLFDMVNSILSDILAPCLDLQPWVNTARKIAPMWGSEGLLEKILHMLSQRRQELALSKPKPKKSAFDQNWPDLADCIDMAGKDVEKMIKDDLLEELVLELVLLG